MHAATIAIIAIIPIIGSIIAINGCINAPIIANATTIEDITNMLTASMANTLKNTSQLNIFLQLIHCSKQGIEPLISVHANKPPSTFPTNHNRDNVA